MVCLDIIVRLFFITFSTFWTYVIFRPQCVDSGYLVSATPHTILYQSFWNFAHVFSMVWRCACGLDIILALIFVAFSTLRTLWFSDLRFYESLETVGSLWAQLLIQFHTDLFETLHFFIMVWRYAYGLDIILELIFVTFSTLWTLSFSDLRFYESLETVGTLWVQLIIQFYTNLYETLHMFSPWSGDVHMVKVWI